MRAQGGELGLAHGLSAQAQLRREVESASRPSVGRLTAPDRDRELRPGRAFHQSGQPHDDGARS